MTQYNVEERPKIEENDVNLTKNPTSVNPEMPMLTLMLFGYITMAAIQLIAIATGLVETWGWNWLLAIPLTVVVVAIPVVGACLGVWAASAVWGWHWFAAFCLFFWPLVIAAGLYVVRYIKSSKVPTK